MPPWVISYISDAEKDLEKLDGSQRLEVIKAVSKVSKNPLPYTEGGYGKPLGSRSASNLHGLLKVVLKKSGIRIVYRLIKEESTMKIIIIAARKDEYVYKEASKRV